MTVPASHLCAPLPAAEARALFDARRQDMLNAWRHLVRGIGQVEAQQEAKATASAMRQMAALEGRS